MNPKTNPPINCNGVCAFNINLEDAINPEIKMVRITYEIKLTSNNMLTQIKAPKSPPIPVM